MAASEADLAKASFKLAATAAKEGVKILGTSASCSVADVLADLTDNRGKADRLLLDWARNTYLLRKPRARQHLAHFLNGSGDDVRFPLRDLLSEDAGAREIVRRHFIRPLRKGVITIGQSAYQDDDWRNALGTYFIEYVEVGMLPSFAGVRTRHVLAWGEDTYRWHPDDEARFTQCLHLAASRLLAAQPHQIPKAKTFRMIGEAVVLDTTTGMPSHHPLASQKLNMHSRPPMAGLPTEAPQFMCRGR